MTCPNQAKNEMTCPNQTKNEMTWPNKTPFAPCTCTLVNTIYELVFVLSNPEDCDGDVNTCPFLSTWTNLHRWYVVAGDNCVRVHEYVHGKRICEGICASAIVMCFWTVTKVRPNQ